MYGYTYWYTHNIMMYSFVCHFSKLEHIAHYKEPKHRQHKLSNTHTPNSLFLSLSLTHTQSIWQLDEVRFPRWSKKYECIWWPNFARETVPDKWCSIKKRRSYHRFKLGLERGPMGHKEAGLLCHHGQSGQDGHGHRALLSAPRCCRMHHGLGFQRLLQLAANAWKLCHWSERSDHVIHTSRCPS